MAVLIVLLLHSAPSILQAATYFPPAVGLPFHYFPCLALPGTRHPDAPHSHGGRVTAGDGKL